MRLMKTLVLTCALAVGAAATLPGDVRAEEAPARERVELLMPRLQSDDDAVREQAEQQLFRLGEAGRREMERLSRDTDTRRALTALRLMQSDRWATPGLRDGEQPLQRSERSADGGSGRLADLEREMDARFEGLRKQLEDALEDLTLPKMPTLGLAPPADGGSITLQGTVVRGDRRLTWRRAADGSVRVTVRVGEGDEQTFEAADMEAFRAAHPDVAAELDAIVPTWTGAPTVRMWDRVPEFRIPPSVWRWWHDESDAVAPGTESPSTATPPQGQAGAGGPMLGIQWGPLSPLLRHHLQLGDTGVVVERVLPDTLAARLRMEEMDILISLAGSPIRGRADIGDALGKAQREAPGTAIQAVVVRRGERRTLREVE